MSTNLGSILINQRPEPIERSRGYLASAECTNADIYFKGGRHDWRVEIPVLTPTILTRIEDGARIANLLVTVSLP